MKSPSRTLLVALFAAAFTIALPLESVSAAAPAPQARFVLRPNLTVNGPLTRAQVLSLTRHVNKPVIILLKEQFTSLESHARRALLVRDAAIAASQRGVLAELKTVKASHVLPFHLINGIRATISSAEEARLRANPAVLAVQPNATIAPPELVTSVAQRERTMTRSSRSANPGSCSGTSAVPILQPQALQLTNTAFQNPKTPQAQNIVTGKGVTVAIVSGPLAPYNSDFIRANGKPVITDFESFGGDPPYTPGGGGGWDAESFLDMSSVGSQGNEVFDLNDWANNLGSVCHTIRIEGMAPGANVMWLDAVGENGETDSNFIQAVQYAVDFGANVISESFGGNPNNDTGIDAISLADAAAVQAGLSVVVSSGDAGSNNSVGTAGTIDPVIAVGATTSFQEESLIGRLHAQGNTGWVDNNVVSFSSSGIDQNGNKTVDVVAPGAFGFIDCSPDPNLFPGCVDYVTGEPLDFSIEGGTSESAPLTAGEAALVIAAYKSTHKNALPSPTTVKQIIMSTATDLGNPSWEQGAGLIDSYKAVRAAKSWGLTAKVGSALVTSRASIAVEGNAGSTHSPTFKVTNDGATAETVAPAGRTLGPSKVLVNTTVKNLAVKGNAETQCAFSFSASYFIKCPPEATVNFKVPAGVGRFDADIAWNTVAQPFGEVELRLVDPDGRYAGNSEPSDNGPPLTSAGYGHVDIVHPTPGIWHAQIKILGFDTTTPTYSGSVLVHIKTSNFIKFGAISPGSTKIAPGQSAQFTLKTKLGSAGDSSADIVVRGKSATGATASAGVIPVILRAMVPTNSGGGSFSGYFMGGNGRGGGLWSTAFDFNVPNGESNLSLGVKVGDSHDNLQGVLVDPEGYAINIESTVHGFDTNSKSPSFGLPNAYRNTMQFFQIDPMAGVWRFVLEVNDNLSGSMISTPFTGTVRFDVSNAAESGLPTKLSTKLAPGKPVTVSVHLKNTGNTVKNYFLDPRLATAVGYTLSGGLNLPLNRAPFDAPPVLLVPPESGELDLGAESFNTNKTSTEPIMFTAESMDGSEPFGFGSDPEITSSGGFNVATSDYTASASFVTSYELPGGLWEMDPATIGPFPNGEPNTVAAVGAAILTAGFDQSVSSSTGDLWKLLFFGGNHYQPLTLNPGQSGTITATIKPDGPAGSVVQGGLLVDTFAALKGFPFNPDTTAITWSGDEVAFFPYQYTVK